MTNKLTKKQIQIERDSKKLQRVIVQKGYSNGKLPKIKEAHHVVPVAEGGKTTKNNIRIVAKTKHKQIHENRRKKRENIRSAVEKV